MEDYENYQCWLTKEAWPDSITLFYNPPRYQLTLIVNFSKIENLAFLLAPINYCIF